MIPFIAFDFKAAICTRFEQSLIGAILDGNLKIDESDVFWVFDAPIFGELKMTPLAEIQKINEEFADRINQEALANPQSPYAGKWVGIANGHVVAMADTLRDVAKVLRQLEPDPTRVFLVEASRDYSIPVDIWELQ